MFSWLKNWFTFRETQASYSLYSPRERQIYAYFNGREIIKADPIVLWKRLMDKGPEIDIDRKVAASASKDNVKAHTSLVKNIRTVFDVKDLVEGGLTDGEISDLLDHFLTYMDNQKKSTSNSVTSVNNLAASRQSSVESPPMANSSDSGSIAKEVFTVKQVLSAVE